jgi:hypothetical protein
VREQLEKAFGEERFVCLNLSHWPATIPGPWTDEEAIGARIIQLNEALINMTRRSTVAYLLDLAHYLRLGPEGVNALINTIWHIQQYNRLAIVNAGWGGNLSDGTVMASTVFRRYQADAAVVTSAAGMSGIGAFFLYKDKGVFVTGTSSLPPEREYQRLLVGGAEGEGVPLHERVAADVAEEAGHFQNCLLGVAASATYEEGIERIRRAGGDDMLLLITEADDPHIHLGSVLRLGSNSQRSGVILCTSEKAVEAAQRETLSETALANTVDELNLSVARKLRG